LGLAPHDAASVHDAYVKSNARMLAQLRPLCARALGNEAALDRAGPTACIQAIIDGSRKENADKMHEALVKVAEVNAGRRPPPAPGSALEPIEELMLAMSAETKSFESDLAAALGPDDAARVAPHLCVERGMARARPEPQ
jgi:hypothetical protein